MVHDPAFDTEMCEAPVDEDLIDDTVWNKTSRVGDEEGSVSQPNIKHDLLMNPARGKLNSLEVYNTTISQTVSAFRVGESDCAGSMMMEHLSN